MKVHAATCRPRLRPHHHATDAMLPRQVDSRIALSTHRQHNGYVETVIRSRQHYDRDAVYRSFTILGKRGPSRPTAFLNRTATLPRRCTHDARGAVRDGQQKLSGMFAATCDPPLATALRIQDNLGWPAAGHMPLDALGPPQGRLALVTGSWYLLEILVATSPGSRCAAREILW